MLRMFNEHSVRRVASLDGVWELKLPDGRLYPAPVPGVWEMIPDLRSYRGKGVYSRFVTLDKDGAILLRFGGVSHTARVFWDGEYVGEHYNAYTGFDLLIQDAKQGEHELTVEVDSSFSESSTLHVPNDYYTYGGINRGVELDYLGDAYISRVAFYSVENERGSFGAHIRAYVTAINDIDGMECEVALAGKAQRAKLPAIKKRDRAEIEFTLENLDVRRWDVNDGQLYYLSCALIKDNKTVDDLIDRVGFRTVEVNGEDILINQKKVQILGFNRHEEHGQLGLSPDVGSQMCDLLLMLDMGANSVRTCHYPNDPRFLDLCDELGILVWEEHHARALPGEILRSELFTKQISDCNYEMITQHVNHPSIYVWGILNECESETEFGHELYKRNFEQLRALDPTRPVTFASCRHFKDICLDLVDIVSFNTYPGWYEKTSVGEHFKKLLGWMEQSGAKGKPILISEIGAGAIPGFHDPLGKSKWSEERQSELLSEQLSYVLNNPRLSGVYIWQFADVRVDEGHAMHRPRTMNNKGVVDQYRVPKLAYATVKAEFHRHIK